jgi:hypothetical protein
MPGICLIGWFLFELKDNKIMVGANPFSSALLITGSVALPALPGSFG